MTKGNDKKSNILRRPAVFSYQAHCYFLGIITESLFVYFFTPSGIKCYTIFNLVTVLCKTLCEFFSLLKCPISIISYSVTSLTHSLSPSLRSVFVVNFSITYACVKRLQEHFIGKVGFHKNFRKRIEDRRHICAVCLNLVSAPQSVCLDKTFFIWCHRIIVYSSICETLNVNISFRAQWSKKLGSAAMISSALFILLMLQVLLSSQYTDR